MDMDLWMAGRCGGDGDVMRREDRLYCCVVCQCGNGNVLIGLSEYLKTNEDVNNFWLYSISMLHMPCMPD